MIAYENAFIFHGAHGNSEENWFPWLKNELEAQGIPTTVPNFPTPEGESLEAWFEVLNKQSEKIGPKSLVVGHSRGGMFLLKVLERLSEPVAAAILVAAPVGERPILYYDEDKAFSNFEFDWLAIHEQARDFAVFHSDNDPYVSLPNGERLAAELGVDLTFIPEAGHFNIESGYNTFPKLLETIDSF